MDVLLTMHQMTERIDPTPFRIDCLQLTRQHPTYVPHETWPLRPLPIESMQPWHLHWWISHQSIHEPHQELLPALPIDVPYSWLEHLVQIEKDSKQSLQTLHFPTTLQLLDE
jgi:hypothetical protein